MSQPVNTFGLEMDISEDIFRVKGNIILVVPDIIDLFIDGWLNVSII
jgi:hypothetical protein